MLLRCLMPDVCVTQLGDTWGMYCPGRAAGGAHAQSSQPLFEARRDPGSKDTKPNREFSPMNGELRQLFTIPAGSV